MKAITVNGFGDVSRLVWTDLRIPRINEQEVLVQVKAISINPVDVKTRAGFGVAGHIKQADPIILGWDISGIVVATGPAVNTLKTGDEVFGMVNFPGHGKAYAEFVAVPASQLALKPATISHPEAAAATLAALTAWQALSHYAHIQPGQQVLVHAGAGGVGHYAVQLAKHLGATVTATSSAANRDFVLGLGADTHIDYQSTRFEEAIHDVDFVLDTIGGDNIDRSLAVIKPGGTIISIPSGLNETVTEKAKSKGIHGYFILVKSSGEDMKQLAAFLEKGIIKSHIFQTFAFEDMGAAHLLLERGRTVGKIVVTL